VKTQGEHFIFVKSIFCLSAVLARLVIKARASEDRTTKAGALDAPSSFFLLPSSFFLLPS